MAVLLLVLAKNKNAKITAIDVSEGALVVAKENAKINGVRNQLFAGKIF